MKRFRLILAASMLMTLGAAGLALADAPTHNAGGLGFHSVEAPVGVRWWFSNQKMALDVGLGFGSAPAPIDPDENETNYAIEFGVPIVLYSWDKVHGMLRPGILYQSQQVGFDSDPGTPGVQFDTENETTFDFMLEIEAEAFLAENFSVSAAHGIGFRNFEPAGGGDSSTSFGTLGNNFTTIGFHLYLFK